MSSHPFCFRYGDKTYCFLFDTESGSLHNVDRVTFLCAKERYKIPLTEEEKSEYALVPAAEKDEINAELDELVSMGVLESECGVVMNKKRVGEVKALCLHICHDCNLRCRYCFADEGTYHTADRAHMPVEVGLKAVDFLIANSGNRRNLEIDFFGGEPLMNMKTVKAVVEYARSREKETGKTFNFTMTTNCLFLNDENIRWLNDNMYNVVLSIDGRRDVHNRVRKTPNGKDVFDVIKDNALRFRAVRGDKSYYVRGTFTAHNLDFADDVLYLNDLGFDQISMEPVVTDIPDLAIKEEHIPAILDEYERLARAYIDRRKTDKWFNFFHFMIDLDGGPCVIKRLTGCGSGCEYLAVTPRGDIYPCHQFAENKPYYMGNVLRSSDYDLGVSEKFARNIVTNKPECADCIAKYYCSGGCVANNLNYAGSMDKPYGISCMMMRKRMELSLAISAIESAPDNE